MKKSDKIKLQKMTLDQLQKELTQTQKELVENTIKHSLEPIKNTSVFKKTKYKISLLMSLINQNKYESKN